MTKLPQTPRARAVLQAADKHAGPRKVSPLDILQALYSEQDGAAYQVMMDLKWFPETKAATPPISIIGRITELEKRLALLEERIG